MLQVKSKMDKPSVILVVVLGLSLVEVRADFGGHDLFTSLAQLEVLWHNERTVVEDMKQMIEANENENVTKALKK